ncbi:hypothetical protein Scep_012369 [Stephania cephalantha]|uniref:DUF4283 domain-containing protein n=1 Tax=Stephania cephalantha TaxID=152367 RepID=A0AAP0JGF1_9MAGN
MKKSKVSVGDLLLSIEEQFRPSQEQRVYRASLLKGTSLDEVKRASTTEKGKTPAEVKHPVVDTVFEKAKYSPPIIDHACRCILLFEGLEAKIQRPWKRTRIAKLLGKTMSYNYMTTKMKTMWLPEGEMEVSEIGNGFFAAKFAFESDMHKALEGGQWTILDTYMCVQRWQPKLC